MFKIPHINTSSCIHDLPGVAGFLHSFSTCGNICVCVCVGVGGGHHSQGSEGRKRPSARDGFVILIT